MEKSANFFKHLLHINEGLYEVVRLPFEKRVKPLKELISYFEKNLSSEESDGIKEVIEMKERLYRELSEAMHFESSYNLLYVAFAKARDQLRHNYDQFEGFGDLLEQIPCKSSEETIIRLLAEDNVSLEDVVKLYLAEHNAILHPEAPNRFKEMLERFPL